MRDICQHAMSAHVAVPIYRNLVLAGLLSPEAASAAIADIDPRAAISPCGRKARLLLTQVPSPAQATTRGAAATAVRNALSVLLARRVGWAALFRTARDIAAPGLTTAEIEALIREQIAARVRRSAPPNPQF